MTNLYDLIAALGANIPKEKLQDEHLQNTILEILIKKWNDSYFNDRESIYLVGKNLEKFCKSISLECTNSILSLLGNQSLAHSDFFVTRLLYLIVQYIQAKKVNFVYFCKIIFRTMIRSFIITKKKLLLGRLIYWGHF